MSDQRVTTERRADNKAILSDLRDKLDKVHDRVFNGMPKEIRAELKIEIDKLNARLWMLLSALFKIGRA